MQTIFNDSWDEKRSTHAARRSAHQPNGAEDAIDPSGPDRLRVVTPSRALVLLLFAGLFTGVGVASAATRYVRSTDGVNAGFCTSSASPCATISYAVGSNFSRAEDIVLIAGEFDESVSLTRSITILGKSASTLFGASFGDCSGNTGSNRCPTITSSTGSAFAVSAASGDTVSIQDVIVQDVVGSPAIRMWSGKLDLRRATVSDNSWLSVSGAAIAVYAGATAVVFDSLFERNSAGSAGGAIDSSGVLEITDSVFRLNSAMDGGAVHQDTVPIGGQPIPVLEISGSTFEQNFATQSGGAIALGATSLGFTEIADTTFTSNAAGVSGGALFGAKHHVTLSGSSFDANRVDTIAGIGRGGAIQLERASGSLTDMTLRDNVLATTTGQPLRGAGLSITDLSELDLLRVSILDSVLDSNGSTFSSVGGLNVEESSVDLTDLSIVGNEGHGVRVWSADLTITDSTVEANDRSGLYLALGLFGDRSDVVIEGSTFSDNGGYGIQHESAGAGEASDVQIVNSTLSGNNSNLYLGRDSLFDISFTTIANAFAAIGSSSGTVAIVSDSIVSGSCPGSASGASVSLINGSRWDSESCGAPSGTSADLGLLPLADNGGPTLTHALAPTSPAIDAAALRCLAPPVGAVDQRGEPRPEGTFCDAGAVEAPEPRFAIGLAVASLWMMGLRARRQRGHTKSGAS